jgi:hypothetical protein
VKNKRLYSLFRRAEGERRWVRVEGCGAYYQESAIRIFQDRLLRSALSGDTSYEFRLRPVASSGGL